jgi:phosphoglycolate phosphatase
MGLELVLLDWSGTVSDDRQPVYLAVARQMIEYGLSPPSFEEFYKNVQGSAVAWFSQFPHSSVPVDPNVINADYQRLFTAAANECETLMYDDVPEAFGRLRATGLPIAVISSHPTENLEHEAIRYGLRHHINEIIGNAKQKMPYISALAERYDAPKDRVIYVGDTTFDLLAAHEAGVLSVGITGPADKLRGYHTRERLMTANPHYLIETLLDLTDEKTLARCASHSSPLLITTL